MKNLFLVICLFITALLAGCATIKTPQAINGSKADGTITLAYDVSAFENPIVDWNFADTTARARCSAWGYKNAEAFGGRQTHCTTYNEYGCAQEQVNIIYQCTK